ncbi:MAG: redoxin domain-containing protein [Acidimicrobiia bacterium]|nr:redoxin domain-containing protein [Acidimicrobiia bacterium]
MDSPRPRRVAVLAAAFSLAAAACGPSAGGSDPELDFSASQLEGGTVEAASFEGSDTVLWFWAPWCTTCRGEAPDILEVAGEYEGEVEIVGVASRGNVEEMHDFVDDTGTGSLRHLVDESGDIWSRYEVVNQPAFAFIDDDGSTDVHVGALGADGLRQRLADLTES